MPPIRMDDCHTKGLPQMMMIGRKDVATPASVAVGGPLVEGGGGGGATPSMF